jgi:hypothetical protein
MIKIATLLLFTCLVNSNLISLDLYSDGGSRRLSTFNYSSSLDVLADYSYSVNIFVGSKL